MARKTIAVDLDDVLSVLAKGFTEFSNKKWGTKLKPDDYSEHWAFVWGVDEEEAKRRGKIIHANASSIISGLSHDPNAEDTLAQLAKKYKLVIVTSRRRVIQKDTIEWVKKYFKGI